MVTHTEWANIKVKKKKKYRNRIASEKKEYQTSIVFFVKNETTIEQKKTIDGFLVRFVTVSKTQC